MRATQPAGRCCSMLGEQLDEWRCADHDDRVDCPDALLWERRDGRVGIIVHDGGSSMVEIRYCPWCGTEVRHR